MERRGLTTWKVYIGYLRRKERPREKKILRKLDLITDHLLSQGRIPPTIISRSSKSKNPLSGGVTQPKKYHQQGTRVGMPANIQPFNMENRKLENRENLRPTNYFSRLSGFLSLTPVPAFAIDSHLCCQHTHSRGNRHNHHPPLRLAPVVGQLLSCRLPTPP